MTGIIQTVKKDLDKFYRRSRPTNESRSELVLCAELARAIGGVCEVRTPVGRIDLLNDYLIVETKRAREWKHAIGQLLCYRIFYDRPYRAIGLIGDVPKYCPDICEKHDIILLNYCPRQQRWVVY